MWPCRGTLDWFDNDRTGVLANCVLSVCSSWESILFVDAIAVFLVGLFVYGIRKRTQKLYSSEKKENMKRPPHAATDKKRKILRVYETLLIRCFTVSLSKEYHRKEEYRPFTHHMEYFCNIQTLHIPVGFYNIWRVKLGITCNLLPQQQR